MASLQWQSNVLGSKGEGRQIWRWQRGSIVPCSHLLLEGEVPLISSCCSHTSPLAPRGRSVGSLGLLLFLGPTGATQFFPPSSYTALVATRGLSHSFVCWNSWGYVVTKFSCPYGLWIFGFPIWMSFLSSYGAKERCKNDAFSLPPPFPWRHSLSPILSSDFLDLLDGTIFFLKNLSIFFYYHDGKIYIT